VIARLERGELTLDENVSLFERGVQLSNACKAQLSDAERRIQALVDPTERGPVRVQELDVEDEEDDELEDEE
jgi:exodeoxyribonuclease VII small subunit